MPCLQEQQQQILGQVQQRKGPQRRGASPGQGRDARSRQPWANWPQNAPTAPMTPTRARPVPMDPNTGTPRAMRVGSDGGMWFTSAPSHKHTRSASSTLAPESGELGGAAGVEAPPSEPGTPRAGRSASMPRLGRRLSALLGRDNNRDRAGDALGPESVALTPRATSTTASRPGPATAVAVAAVRQDRSAASRPGHGANASSVVVSPFAAAAQAQAGGEGLEPGPRQDSQSGGLVGSLLRRGRSMVRSGSLGGRAGSLSGGAAPLSSDSLSMAAIGGSQAERAGSFARLRRRLQRSNSSTSVASMGLSRLETPPSPSSSAVPQTPGGNTGVGLYTFELCLCMKDASERCPPPGMCLQALFNRSPPPEHGTHVLRMGTTQCLLLQAPC